MAKFFISKYKSGKTRKDILLEGQNLKERAEHIASIHGEKLVGMKLISTPKYIRKHQKKYGF